MVGLYIHTPFCTQKCAYCDFFSAPPAGEQLQTWHLLIQQNLQLLTATKKPALDTIFFGGGTPSLLSPAQISHILNSCRGLFSVSNDAEISLEANPNTLSTDSLTGFRAAGINRLSIGIQSFNDQALHLLGRRHSSAQARQAFHAAREAGFDNISVDLIFALPQQATSRLDQEINQLLELAPDHIGIYGLSVEAGTPLEKQLSQGKIEETDEETYVENYLLLSRLLTEAGYEHYEISNFARPGHRCRHNQGYWQRNTCLAAGAGAHGFEKKGFGLRTAIPDDLVLYQQRLDAGLNPAERLEDFDLQQAMAETLYLGLRTSEGVGRCAFAKQFGRFPEDAFPTAFQTLSSNLLLKEDRYFFTPNEWLIYDHLISHFL